MNTVRGSVRLDGGTYRLQISYVYYKLESKVTSNFDVTSKKLGRFEKKKIFMTISNFLVVDDQQK